MKTDFYSSCKLCPRNCGVGRTAWNSSTPVSERKAGFCMEPSEIRLAVACLHFGEEPLLTVNGGSGTIFLTGCNLRCAFCQNYQISQKGMGKNVSADEFAEICLKLQSIGAENINIVTGSHHVPAIAKGLEKAKLQGLSLPVCWNSSGYDSVESLKMLDGLVSIYLPDLKTLSSELSKSLCSAADYPSVAKKAIEYMISKNPLKIVEVADASNPSSKKEKIESGVIVRHLFLPGKFFETADVLEWLHQNVDGKAIISLMSQYTPVPFKESDEENARRKKALSVIENRLVNESEDNDLRDLIEAYDFDYLFYQDLCQDTEWLPDFEKIQPFSYKLAKPVWHWSKGFVEN
ncbi:MAG: radical SAM protein [Treponema sp.]|nr:radical SAM protein [Treponema sp.]